MRLLAVLFALSAVAGAVGAIAPAAAPTIKGELKYDPHALVKLQAENVPAKAGVVWRIYPRTGVQRATTTNDRLEFAAHPGTYEIDLLVISLDKDGVTRTDEAACTVVVKSCLPPQPPPPDKPKPPGPGGGTLDPSNAIGRIQFGSAGCSATVIAPRRADGRWNVLSAAHCIGSVGQSGSIRMPKSGKTYGLKVVKYDRNCDVSWLLTNDSIDDIEYAHLATSNPPVGTGVWHQGYGFDRPRNREEGVVTGGENSSGQLRFTLNVSSGDSGGGILRIDTNEVISTVCCTQSIAAKTSMWGGSTMQARRLLPTTTEETSGGTLELQEQTDWKPLPIPVRPDHEASAPPAPTQTNWTPIAMPICTEPVAQPQLLMGWPGHQLPVQYQGAIWRVSP